MRAFVVTDYAHPTKIPLTQDAPAPKLGRGQVLVDVYSAGLNYFDVRVPLLRGVPPSHSPLFFTCPIPFPQRLLHPSLHFCRLYSLTFALSKAHSPTSHTVFFRRIALSTLSTLFCSAPSYQRLERVYIPFGIFPVPR